MVTTKEPVTVSLKDLEQGTISLSALDEAFGPDSLGIIVVKDLPTKFVELRHKVLSFSSYLANLSKEELDKLESPTSTYLTGWSLGREKLKNDRPDTLKGSYYINAAFHKDPSLECSPTSRPHDYNTSSTSSTSTTTSAKSSSTESKHYDTFPEYTTPNLWPTEALLPGFRPATTELCNLIIDTATLVARACDRFAGENVPEYEHGYLERMVRDSMTTKARLLHYFPAPAPTGKAASATAEDEDDWCATHLDHGCLTGLTSAMYVDEALCFPSTPSSPDGIPHATPTSTDEGGANVPLPLPELQASPDSAAGLYIQSRGGEVVQVKIPRDCLAFQTGAALESVTRGRLRAVPHFVRGVRNTSTSDSTSTTSGQSRVARNTLAIFTQPNLWDVVDTEKGVDFATFSRGVIEKNY